MRVIIWILGYMFITNYLPYLGIDLGSKGAEISMFKGIIIYAGPLDILSTLAKWK